MLYKLISDETQTFEAISEKFNFFFDKDMKDKAATTLLILLEDNLLNLHQRIISYFILYDISREEQMETNPFLSIILKRLEKSTNKSEQNFLIDYLCKKINYSDLSVDKYLNNNSKEQRLNVIQIQMQWDKYYKAILKQNNININKDNKIRPVIYERNNLDIKNIDHHPNNDMLEFINNNNELNLNSCKTNYMSYYPVNNGFLIKEPIWLLPSLNHKFLWEKK
jgi:hypothetical protein